MEPASLFSIAKGLTTTSAIAVGMFCLWKMVDKLIEVFREYTNPKSSPISVHDDNEGHQKMWEKIKELQEEVVVLETNHMAHFSADLNRIEGKVDKIDDEQGDLRERITRVESLLIL